MKKRGGGRKREVGRDQRRKEGRERKRNNRVKSVLAWVSQPDERNFHKEKIH